MFEHSLCDSCDKNPWKCLFCTLPFHKSGDCLFYIEYWPGQSDHALDTQTSKSMKWPHVWKYVKKKIGDTFLANLTVSLL